MGDKRPKSFEQRTKIEQNICPTCKVTPIKRELKPALLSIEDLISIHGHVPTYFFRDFSNVENEIVAPNSERMNVSLGCLVTEAIKEGIEIARDIDRHVCFVFNGVLVTCRKESDPEQLYKSWHFTLYKEAPEQTAAKR